MGASTMVTAWTGYLKSEVFGGCGQRLVNALAMFSVMISEARHCQSGRLSTQGYDQAKPASRRRRWERLLANDRFAPTAVQDRLISAVWRRWRSQRPLLLLDETAKSNDLRSLRVSLAYRRRAVPLVAVCYHPRRPPRPMPKLVQQVLSRAIASMPSGLHPVVVADRGLAWPAVVDWCQRHDCHYLLRLQRSTRVRTADGCIRSAGELAPQPGCRPWRCRAEVFRKAGWRTTSVIAQWERGCREPWLLITDQTACAGRWKQYARRMWIEEAFRDEKSQGFQWQTSHVNDPRHAERLLVVIALAMLLMLSLGTWLIKRGFRRHYDPRRHRRLSLFQIGLQALHDITHRLGINWPVAIYLCPN